MGQLGVGNVSPLVLAKLVKLPGWNITSHTMTIPEDNNKLAPFTETVIEGYEKNHVEWGVPRQLCGRGAGLLR